MTTQDGKRVRHRPGEGRPVNSRLFLAAAAVVLVLMGTRLLLDMVWPMEKSQPQKPTGSVTEPVDGSADVSTEEGEEKLPPQKEPSREEKLEYIRTSGQYPEKLAAFAEHYGEVLDYVYDYPEKKDVEHQIDLTEEAKSEKVPLLIQWDERWGYEPYAGGLMGYAGCGPTCLSMAALYLTHDPEQTPLKAAEIAERWGYAQEGVGSAWTLFSEGSRLLGLHPQELPLDENVMKQALDQGKLIVLSVGKGDFTQSGHYLLVTGYKKKGFTLNDPNSPENSGKVWPYEKLKGQIKNLWSMSAR